jgi:hypothetical protein
MSKKDTSEYAASETAKLRVRRAETVTLKGLSIEETVRDRIGKAGFNPYDKPPATRKGTPSTTDLQKLSAEILAKRGKPVR